MPQEFHVLQCCRCRTFQVHQVKKAKKWACKMCGEKQSVLRVYGRGTGAECRQHVQKLNSLRGELETKEQLVSATRAEDSADHLENFQIDKCEVEQQTQTKDSKWSQYMETVSADHVDDEDDENSTYTTDWGRYNTNIRQHRKQKRTAYKQKAQNIDQTTNDETPWIDVNFKPTKNQGSSIKRPPENCLRARAVKRTKWAAYVDEENSSGNLDQSRIIPLIPKPKISTNQRAGIAESANQNSTAIFSTNRNRGTDISSNQQSMTIESARSKDLIHKSFEKTIPEVDFTLCDIDEFLDDKDDEPVEQKENFSASKKSTHDKMRKRSKWDAYLSQSSDEEAPENNKGGDSNVVGNQPSGKFPSEFERHETRGSKADSSNEFKETAHDSSSVSRHRKIVKSPKPIIFESSCDSDIILPALGVESGVDRVIQPKLDSEEDVQKQCPIVKNIIGSEQLFNSESTGKGRTARPVFQLEDLDDADFEFSVY